VLVQTRYPGTALRPLTRHDFPGLPRRSSPSARAPAPAVRVRGGLRAEATSWTRLALLREAVAGVQPLAKCASSTRCRTSSRAAPGSSARNCYAVFLQPALQDFSHADPPTVDHTSRAVHWHLDVDPLNSIRISPFPWILREISRILREGALRFSPEESPVDRAPGEPETAITEQRSLQLSKRLRRNPRQIRGDRQGERAALAATGLFERSPWRAGFLNIR